MSVLVLSKELQSDELLCRAMVSLQIVNNWSTFEEQLRSKRKSVQSFDDLLQLFLKLLGVLAHKLPDVLRTEAAIVRNRLRSLPVCSRNEGAITAFLSGGGLCLRAGDSESFESLH